MPGSRTAVNLSGVEAENVRRGETVAHPGRYQPSRRLDVRIRLLRDLNAPLKHGTEIKFFIGAAETIATARLLEGDALAPGAEGWVQLELRDPVIAVRGDRFILRRPSPGETLGGGVIVDPHPKERHRRNDEAVLKRLSALSAGSPADVLLQAALALGAAPLREMIARARLEAAPAQSALDELIAAGDLIVLEDGRVSPSADLFAMARPAWLALREKMLQMVAAYHQTYPLRRGIPREELKSRLKAAPRLFNLLAKRLSAEGELVEAGAWTSRPGHAIRFDDGQQARVRSLLQKFAAAPYAPPALKECQAEAGEEIVSALIELGDLIAVSQEVLFRTSDYAAMVARIREHIGQKGAITVAEARDLFDTSRKYILALMEHLDATGVTVREGDLRRLRKRA